MAKAPQIVITRDMFLPVNRADMDARGGSWLAAAEELGKKL